MADKKDDDITDLTGDEGAAGNGKDKKRKTAKKGNDPDQPAPKAGGGAPGAEGSVGEGKKGKPKRGGRNGKRKLVFKLALIIVPVLLVAGFVAALVINLFGVRYSVGSAVKGPLLKAVVWFDPEFKSVDDALKANNKERETELDAREADIGKRESEIAGREAELDDLGDDLAKREAQLDRRSKALDSREDQMNKPDNSAAPLLNRAMSEQELADIQSLSRSYAQMDPGTAAGILVELKDEQHVATILYHMAERNAAAILSVMEPAFAAKITEILLPS